MKPGDPKLVRIARRLVATIDPDSCAVAGAMAVAVHGYARATADVDLVSRLPLPEVRKRLADHGVKAALDRCDVPLGRGETLKFVDLPTLIHLKLRAGGPQDVLDVMMLLQQHPAEVVRARELATAYGLAAQLESFMASPRVKAKASGTVGRRARRSKRS